MKRFWRGKHHDVEAELRSYRPEPRREFLAALKADLNRRTRRPLAVRRVALASALTVGMLTVFATLGGIGYASSAAKNAIHVTKVERLVGFSHGNSSVNASHVNGKDEGKDEDDQGEDEDNEGEHEYRPGKGCGDKNHVHLRENECKKHHHHHEHEHGDEHGDEH